MVKNLRPLVDKLNSVDFLNAVRNNSGWEYQSRIPEATQANISETIDSIWEVSITRNQVVDALVNRVGFVMFVQQSWQNPFAEFKHGNLAQGEVVEEVMVGLLKAVDYDFDRNELEKEIFGRHDIEVQSKFHKVNRRDRYVVTINTVGLRLALLNGELGSFVGNVLGAIQTSDQYDEFLLMTKLLSEWDRSFDGNLHTVKVDDVGDPDSGTAESKYLLRRLREYSNTVPFMSRLYNPAGMPRAFNPKDLILITTPGADAAMDVEALAGAFQVDKAEFGSRKIVVPEANIGIPGTQAILTTKDFFRVFDVLMEPSSQFNAATLATNYWYHHHQIISASPFAPFILFNSLRESTVIPVNDYSLTDIGTFTITDGAGVVAATNVKRGVLYDVKVEATTSPAGGPNIALDLDVLGKTSQFTYITNNGDLYIGPDEEAESLTIRATAIDGTGYTEEVTRGVVGTLIVFQPPAIIPDDDLDALEEVTPEKPLFSANVIKIPNQTGVQYKDGATNLVNGQEITVVNGTPKTITAVARAGKELATGATASWVFTYVAP